MSGPWICAGVLLTCLGVGTRPLAAQIGSDPFQPIPPGVNAWRTVNADCGANNDQGCDVSDLVRTNLEIFDPRSATCKESPEQGR